MSDFNSEFATATSGTYKVRCERILHGISIVGSESEAASRKAYYPVAVTATTFTITVAFPNFEARERFNRWITGFMRSVVDGHGFNAAMRVSVPSRNFMRVGVPTGPILYGEGLRDLKYTLDIEFVAAYNPVDMSVGAKHGGPSHFRLPTRGKQDRYFYPASKQLSGASTLEGSIYDGRDGWDIGGGLASDPTEDSTIPFADQFNAPTVGEDALGDEL